MENAENITKLIIDACKPCCPCADTLVNLIRRANSEILDKVDTGAFKDDAQLRTIVPELVDLCNTINTLRPFYKKGSFDPDHQMLWEYLRDNRRKFDSDHRGVCPPNTFDDFPLEAHAELPKYQPLDHDSLVCLRQKELLLKKLIEFMNKENSQLLA